MKPEELKIGQLYRIKKTCFLTSEARPFGERISYGKGSVLFFYKTSFVPFLGPRLIHFLDLSCNQIIVLYNEREFWEDKLEEIRGDNKK